MSGQVRVLATGGHGGAGCESYIKRSRKGTFRPIPDGGHGGQGGDVIVEACSSYGIPETPHPLGEMPIPWLN